MKWNSQISNGTAKSEMEQPNLKWNSQISNGTAKCQMEQPNVKWNSQISNGTVHDIENLKFGAKAACLQPGFHLTFVHYR